MTGIVGQSLGSAVQVRVTNRAGNPIGGIQVHWRPSAGSVSPQTAVSSADGIAQTVWTLPNVAGAHTLDAHVKGLDTLRFEATTTPAAAAALSILSGNAQVDTVGATLPEPILAEVTDSFGNPVPDHPVVFDLSGERTTVETDSLGRVAAEWTPPATDGIHFGTVSAGSSTALTHTVSAQSRYVELRTTYVAAGLRHSCGILASGRAACWGSNSHGQLGDGTTTDRGIAVGVLSGELRFSKLSAGFNHTCGLSTSGDAHCWGLNHAGLLGNGDTISRSTPQQVAGGHKFVDVVSASWVNCGLTGQGAVWCWGALNGLQAGFYLPRLSSGTVTFRSIFLGGGGTIPCGIGTDGRTYCMYSGYTHWSPTLLEGAIDLHLIRLAGDAHRMCGVTTSGTIYCWGTYPHDADFMQVSQLPSASGFIDVIGGYTYHCGMRSETDYACWGQNHWATWARDDPRSSPTPIGMGLPSGLALVQITGGGDNHQCGRDRSGLTYCWGLRRDALGNGEPPVEFGTQSTPAPARRARGLM